MSQTCAIDKVNYELTAQCLFNLLRASSDFSDMFEARTLVRMSSYIICGMLELICLNTFGGFKPDECEPPHQRR